MKNNVLVMLKNVAVGYENEIILKNVNFEIHKGAFIAMLGPNGSGKTTLLKTIAGIIKPIEGEIFFSEVGNDIALIGYVPQREALDPVFLLSAYEVVLMGTYGRVKAGRRLTKKEKDFAMKCIKLVEAESFAFEQFSELSGGQKQRILIARALAAHPRLLLLDEPTAGIDVSTTHNIMQTLSTLSAEQGLTVLMATHDVNLVKQYIQQIMIIHNRTIYNLTDKEFADSEKMTALLNVTLG